jgi:hypothetical protein
MVPCVALWLLATCDETAQDAYDKACQIAAPFVSRSRSLSDPGVDLRITLGGAGKVTLSWKSSNETGTVTVRSKPQRILVSNHGNLGAKSPVTAAIVLDSLARCKISAMRWKTFRLSVWNRNTQREAMVTPRGKRVYVDDFMVFVYDPEGHFREAPIVP